MKPFLIMITLSLPSVSFGGVENRVHQLLNQWRTAEAAKEAEALLATMPDLPAIQEAAARVNFSKVVMRTHWIYSVGREPRQNETALCCP